MLVILKADGSYSLSHSVGGGNDSKDVSTFQINLAYSLTARSMENRPLTEMLRITISFHFRLSCDELGERRVKQID